MSSSPQTHSRMRPGSDVPRLIVGIGASAGGLRSLEEFFSNVNNGAELAFVVIQHLSPDFESMMDELLARKTSLPIKVAEDQMRVQAGHIYLLPPRMQMTIENGQLRLQPQDSGDGLFLPINIFFHSLAIDQRECSAGVVLSGTGSDGTAGIQAIHQQGGLVIAESLDSAEFDGMPMSAQSSGLVDLVLPPLAMPEVLTRYAKNPGEWRIAHRSGTGEVDTGTELKRIMRLLKSNYDIDFSQYKREMIQRRIDRRLLMDHGTNLKSYVDQLAQDDDLLFALYQDFLIGVTGFFRDEEAYEYLEKTLLPRLLSAREPDAEFRVWVAATATGEEAYSIAMLVDEYREKNEVSFECRIFATDVCEKSLDIASQGVYQPAHVRGVSNERLRKYFDREADGYHISPEIRKMVVFAHHNVISDSPFTKLDMVTCRNLFIYLKPEVQRRVLTLFHFGLKTTGILWLGTSETVNELKEEFVDVNQHLKIYRKRRDICLTNRIRIPETPVPPVNLPANSRVKQQELTSLIATYDQILAVHMPPAILVSEDRELIETFGGASRLMPSRDGRMSRDAIDRLHPSLQLAVATAIRQCSNGTESIRFGGIRADLGQGEELITLAVRPLIHPKTLDRNFLVEFETREVPQIPSDAADDSEMDVEQLSSEHVKRLEDELQLTRQSLEASFQELQSANEELQSTNEELVASNEELQSTNEELHSVNEELYSVNAEYQRKIAELTELSADLDNLLNSTRVATVFLDEQLRIRKFTPDVAKIFSLMDQDIGRGIESFTNSLEDIDLIADLRRVLEKNIEEEREVRDTNGNLYLLKILPYLSRGEVGGLVMTLIEITGLKTAESKLAELSDIVKQSDDAIFRLDASGIVRTWNEGARNLYGWDETVVGHRFSELVARESRKEFDEILEQLPNQRSAARTRMKHLHRSGRTIEVSVSVSAIRDHSGKLVGSSVIVRDIGEQVRAEVDIQRAVERRDQFLAMLSHELRNPLGAIANAARLLADAGKEPSTRKATDVILRQSDQMARLLDGLLDVSRITLGKIDLRPKVFEFNQLIQNAIEDLGPSIDEAGLSLDVNFPDECIFVNGDAARLQQVVINLLRNAIKYTPSGGDIRLTLMRDADMTEVRVRDTGVGIDEDVLDDVFKMFVQAGNTIDRSQGGIGLGLTLVDAIVKLHHGTVEAFSEGPGKGSEFRIRIPLTDVAPSPVHKTSSEVKISRIVVVEDIEDAREMLVALLELQEFETLSAGDGPTGLELIKNEKPDLALVDIGLPDIDGYEIARQIRASEETKGLFLVALTGYGQESDRSKVLEVGFDDHLVKPLNMDDLDRVIRASSRRVES